MAWGAGERGVRLGGLCCVPASRGGCGEPCTYLPRGSGVPWLPFGAGRARRSRHTLAQSTQLSAAAAKAPQPVLSPSAPERWHRADRPRYHLPWHPRLAVLPRHAVPARHARLAALPLRTAQRGWGCAHPAAPQPLGAGIPAGRRVGKARSPLVLAARGHPADPVMGARPKIKPGPRHRDGKLSRDGCLRIPTTRPGGPGGPGSPMLPWGPGKPCNGKSGVREEMPPRHISPGQPGHQLSPGKGCGFGDQAGTGGEGVEAHPDAGTRLPRVTLWRQHLRRSPCPDAPATAATPRPHVP